MNFQQTVVTSHTTMPIVCVVAVVMWMVLPATYDALAFVSPEYGLWHYLGGCLGDVRVAKIGGAVCAAVSIYLMAELNNANMLLRISSRMLSSMLAALLAFALPVHCLQPGCVLMVLLLLAYFPLFQSYQVDSPISSFFLYLFLSVASLVFPLILVLVPVYWVLLIYLRGFSLRVLSASLVGVILPYWLYAATAFLTHTWGAFEAHVTSLLVQPAPLFMADNLSSLLAAPSFHALVLMWILLLTGILDVVRNQLLDKTRTRSLLNAVAWHSVAVSILAVLYSQYIQTLLPILIVDASILYGHFFTFTHTRLARIYNVILIVVAVAVALCGAWCE